MKTIKSSTKLLSILVVLVLAFTACSDNEATGIETQDQDISELRLASEVDKASSAMDDIAIDVYQKQEESELGRRDAAFGLPDCVTVTVVLEQNSREVTIDFGAEGCVVNGNTLKGQIILSWERNPDAQQVFISKSLVDFYFNAKSVEGSKTILKELSNDNGNPQFTHTVSITVTWPNGAQASREGTKVREWIEGAFNGIFSDNVFEVTGNWTTNFVNGNSHSYEVITPLRREVICYYFVSGTVDVQRTNFGGTFDYGEGDCDNSATFTFNNGEEIEVILN